MSHEIAHVDFIGIGAPRCGSTWMYERLEEHPEVCVSHPKETLYFLPGIGYEKTSGEYGAYFKHCKPGQIKGEFSPTYLYFKEAIEKIERDAPKAKLIVVLRNPIDRYLSARYYRALAKEQTPDIESDIQRGVHREIERGYYAKYLKMFLSRFARRQIGIFVYEDMERDPVEFIRSVYEFLGVSADFVPGSVHKKTNITAAGRVRSPLLRRTLKKITKWVVHGPFNTVLAPALKKLGARGMLRRINALNTRLPEELTPHEKPIRAELREQLRAYYDGDIRELEGILGRDLGFWK